MLPADAVASTWYDFATLFSGLMGEQRILKSPRCYNKPSILRICVVVARSCDCDEKMAATMLFHNQVARSRNCKMKAAPMTTCSQYLDILWCVGSGIGDMWVPAWVPQYTDEARRLTGIVYNPKFGTVVLMCRGSVHEKMSHPSFTWEVGDGFLKTKLEGQV